MDPLINLVKQIADEKASNEILTAESQVGERLRFFSQKRGPKIGMHTELGPNAKQFVENAHQLYTEGILKPPFDGDKPIQIKEILNSMDKDLTGDPNSSHPEEREKAEQWKNLWLELQKEHNMSDAQVKAAQDEVLTAYRFKAISISSPAKPWNNPTTERELMPTDKESILIQGYLQDFNMYIRSSQSVDEITNKTNKKYINKFFSDFDSSIFDDKKITLQRVNDLFKNSKELKLLGSNMTKELGSYNGENKNRFNEQKSYLENHSRAYRKFANVKMPYLGQHRQVKTRTEPTRATQTVGKPRQHAKGILTKFFTEKVRGKNIEKARTPENVKPNKRQKPK